MKSEKTNNHPVNPQRRRVLQGAACIGAAGFAPAVVGKTVTVGSTPAALTGELICSISNPVKTLVLRNNSSQTMVVDQLAQSAFMYDGNIVDCNTACQSQPITIRANQEIRVEFDKRQQSSLTHVDDFQRVQSRVSRRGDGTRVIPFVAKMQGNVATVV